MDKQKLKIVDNLISDKSAPDLKGLIFELFKQFPDTYECILLWGKDSASITNVNIEEKLALEYWKKAEKIIDEFNTYGGGSDDEEYESSDYLKNLCELIPTLSWSIRKQIMDEMLTQYHYGNSGFEDYLAECCFSMCKEREEWLYLANDLLEHKRDWNKKLVMDIYKILGDDDKYLELRKSTLKYGSDYFELVEYYTNKQDISTALEYAQKGLENGNGRVDHIVEYIFNYYKEKGDTVELEQLMATCKNVNEECDYVANGLFEYYKNMGDYENLRKYILKEFKYIKSCNLDAQYEKIKLFLKPIDWELVEPSLFCSIKERDIQGYMRLCLEKGLKQEVYDIISAKFSPWSQDYVFFAEKLKFDFPEKIIEYYYKFALHYVENGANRKSYVESMRYFKLAKDVYFKVLKDKERWNRKLLEIRTKYKNRRAFLEESRVLD